jgi:hypothetical protein
MLTRYSGRPAFLPIGIYMTTGQKCWPAFLASGHIYAHSIFWPTGIFGQWAYICPLGFSTLSPWRQQGPTGQGMVEYSNSSDSDFQIRPKSDPNPNSSDSDSDFGFGEKSDWTLVASNSVSDIRFSCRIFESESEKIRVCVSHWITVKPTMTSQCPSCFHISKFDCFQQSGDVNSACLTTGVSGELRPLAAAGRASQRFATSLYFPTLCTR